MDNENSEPTYEWIDTHNARQGNLNRATGTNSLWGLVPGLVYIAAIGLLSAVLGLEISKLFAGQSILLQIIGWGCVVVVGLSAIASYYGKGAVYKSARQQSLGKLFWILEIGALTVGLLVAIADTFGFSGSILDVARFLGFMSIIVAAVGWGILRWNSPEWRVIAERNKTEADLLVKLSELDSQFALSDEMIQIRMRTARENARRNALAAQQPIVLQLPQPVKPPSPNGAKPYAADGADGQQGMIIQPESALGRAMEEHHPKAKY